MANLISKYKKEIDRYLESSISPKTSRNKNDFELSNDSIDDDITFSDLCIENIGAIVNCDPYPTNRKRMSLTDIVGQDYAKDLLTVGIESCKNSERVLDHILLYGPPGSGKSSISVAIADDLGAELSQFLGTELKDRSNFENLLDVLRISSSVKKVIFIDEIHNIPIKNAELLYNAMQDFTMDYSPIDKFTLIGATTNPGKLPRPLRDRFTYSIKLDSYSIEDIKNIVSSRYPKFSDDLCLFIASRSKGIPRIATHYSAIVENASIYDQKEPTLEHGIFAMNLLRIDDNGLTENDRNVLSLLDKAKGSGLGKNTIISTLDIDESDYSFMIEPILLKKGLIAITPKGRALTTDGKKYVRTIRDKNRKTK